VRTRRYRITISGGLGETCREAFRDFHIEPSGKDTALTGDLDQAGLHSALTRIQELALELVEITLLPEPDTSHRADAVNDVEHRAASTLESYLLRSRERHLARKPVSVPHSCHDV
jgi:hypothetical protein